MLPLTADAIEDLPYILAKRHRLRAWVPQVHKINLCLAIQALVFNPIRVFPQELSKVALCDPAILRLEPPLLFPAADLSRRDIKQRRDLVDREDRESGYLVHTVVKPGEFRVNR